MESQAREYTINITAENLRKFIEAMREEGQFSDLFDTGFTTSSFWAKEDKTPERPGYRTLIVIKPQENSVRIRVGNEFPSGEESPAPFLAWGKIREDLERSAYRIIGVGNNELTAVFEHSYVDPGVITNPGHRKAIKALIAAELSPERIPQTDIAKKAGYSPARLSEIKKMYIRPEFREITSERIE